MNERRAESAELSGDVMREEALKDLKQEKQDLDQACIQNRQVIDSVEADLVAVDARISAVQAQLEGCTLSLAELRNRNVTINRERDAVLTNVFRAIERGQSNRDKLERERLYANQATGQLDHYHALDEEYNVSKQDLNAVAD